MKDLNKLSQSALGMYLTCGKKYENHYKKRLRAKVTSGALLFGSAIDKGLNELLTHRNLEKATEIFNQEWEFGWINNKRVKLDNSDLIVYAKKDFDEELLTDNDLMAWGVNSGDKIPLDLYNEILDRKETHGFENLTSFEKMFYNYGNWLCLKRKGHLFLKAYSEKVLSKIKSVIAVQKEFNLVGKKGDVIPGWIDLIVEWEDGKKYVLDNKTSSMEYEPDSASKSKQLILYYYAGNKEGLNLDGVGFVVMNKQIQKNRIKICEECGNNGTGGRAKTCDKQLLFNSQKSEDTFVRCNGAWIETIKPECKIDIILNQITKPAQNLIIQSFIGANEAIKAEIFPPNPDACENYGVKCPYYDLCWKGEDKELIELEEKSDKN